MCRMKAAKAFASALRLASLNVDRTSTVLPPASWARGKRSWFATTHTGAKLVSPFFQLPNHSHAMRMLLARASWMMLSANVKSNLPSCGSIHAQAMGASTVLSPMVARFGHTAFMCSGLEAAVLVSSPARARNGLSSTMSWVAAPRFSRWATGGPVVVVVVGAHAVIKASTPVSAKQARLRGCIISAFRVVFSDALYYHSGFTMLSMPLTKAFRETIRERAQREPRFRKALLREAIELMLSGDEKTGRAILRSEERR